MDGFGAHTAVIALVLILGVAFGYLRGWVRTVTSLAVMALAWVGLTSLGLVVVDLANRLYVMTLFTIGGGFDRRDPASLLASLWDGAPVDPARPQAFYALIVVALAALTNWLAGRLVRGPDSWVDRSLGCLSGLAEGYVILFVSAAVLGGNAAPIGALASTFRHIGEDVGGHVTTVAIACVVAIVAAAVVGTLRRPTRSRSRARAA